MKICPTCKEKYPDSVNFCRHDGEVLDADPTSLVGTTLDNQYQIEAMLGQGGMGTVYRARHILLGDQVAIKILSPNVSGNPEYLRRFRREGQAARRFRHPNAVTVHDMRTTADNLIYMVLEYVEGVSLREELKKHGRFTATEAFQLLEPIADALNAAHEMGVVHRDLKPDNIMVGKLPNGKTIVKLLDLGIAKVHQPAGNAGHTEITTAGQILGTPHYMSPEQWGITPEDGSLEIDARADIYSLGVVFYELITGRKPFSGQTVQDIAREHVAVIPQALHEIVEGVPADFSRAIARAMAKKRADRPATVADLIKDLRVTLAGDSSDKASSELPTILSSPSIPTPLPPVTGNEPIFTQRTQVSGPISIASEVITRICEFEVVTVNAQGQPVERRKEVGQTFVEELGHGVTLEFMLIPAGIFHMGSPETEALRDKTESPQREVKVSPFFLARFPVTQAQWRLVSTLPRVKYNLHPDPSKFKGDNLPVENISWLECLEFCQRLTRRTGRSYRMPSEAEWEYACRARTATPYHFGATITAELANFDGNFPYGEAAQSGYRGATTAVGSYGAANNFGLYDMHGNVWEWCADIWHENYQGAPSEAKVWDKGGNDALRVLRGGSWYSRANACRSALRYADQPESREDTIGLRVAFSI